MFSLLQCVRLITGALHHQKDPYEFPFIPEVSDCHMNVM